MSDNTKATREKVRIWLEAVRSYIRFTEVLDLIAEAKRAYGSHAGLMEEISLAEDRLEKALRQGKNGDLDGAIENLLDMACPLKSSPTAALPRIQERDAARLTGLAPGVRDMLA